MKFRPKDWKKCIKVRDDKKRYTSQELCDMYEAGADAILKLLIDDGEFTYGCHCPDAEAKEESGYWAFIPSEE